MHCAIDFGTSNSAIAMPGRRRRRCGWSSWSPATARCRPRSSISSKGPSTHGPPRAFGRAAVAAYVDGLDGRLMRSMKSILGSQPGRPDHRRRRRPRRAVPRRDRRLPAAPEGAGRGARPARRSAARCSAARCSSSTTTRSATRRRRRRSKRGAQRSASTRCSSSTSRSPPPSTTSASVDHEEIVLVADIGGGTSDFSRRARRAASARARLDRKDDILANHGVHVAGTDFDRRVELASILPSSATAPTARASPARRRARCRARVLRPRDLAPDQHRLHARSGWPSCGSMRGFYADPRQHQRLMTVVTERLGHELAARAEQAKIDVSRRRRRRDRPEPCRDRLGGAR